MSEREKELTQALSNLLNAMKNLPPESFFCLRPIKAERQQAQEVLNKGQ